MMKHAGALCLALLTLPLAAAERPLSGAEFDAYTLGKTLTYGNAGAAYGVEEYFPGRRVMWTFVGDECRAGVWFEQASASGPQICFRYDYMPDDLQCWQFFATGAGLKARFAIDGAGTELTEVQQANGGMTCPGPDLGV